LFEGDFVDNINQYMPAKYFFRLVSILSRFRQVFFIIGNHDYHKALGLSWEDEPIGLISKFVPGMKLLTEEKIGKYTLLGRNWKKDYDRNVASEFECPDGMDPTKTIMAVHAYLLPKSENVMMKFNQLEDLENPVHLYLVGHYHKNLGWVTTVNTQALIPGSLTRIKSSENHTPTFFVLDLDSDDLKASCVAVPVPALDGNIVFKDLSDKKQIQFLNSDIKDFVKSLDREISVMSMDDFISAFAGISALDFPEEHAAVNRLLLN
jgi:DNA repair exonuclease SbcCD nuclease subunit